jgi:hypothetical protein
MLSRWGSPVATTIMFFRHLERYISLFFTKSNQTRCVYLREVSSSKRLEMKELVFWVATRVDGNVTVCFVVIGVGDRKMPTTGGISRQPHDLSQIVEIHSCHVLKKPDVLITQKNRDSVGCQSGRRGKSERQLTRMSHVRFPVAHPGANCFFPNHYIHYGILDSSVWLLSLIYKHAHG